MLFPLPGSKVRLTLRIADLLGGVEFDTYVEPFVGSASIYLGLRRAGLIGPKVRVLLNDRDAEITNLFNVVREHADELAWAVALTPYAQQEVTGPPPEADRVERARSFLARAHMAFPTDYSSRVRKFVADRDGQYLDRWRALPDLLLGVVEALQQAAILDRDALAVVRRYAGPTTLFVVDPPYAGREDLYEQQFAEHETLFRLLGEVDAAGVVVTHARHPRLGDWLPKSRWEAWEFDTKTARGKKRRTDVVYVRRERPMGKGARARCASCGEQFIMARLDAIYCSGACRQRAYRRRIRAE